MICVGTCCYQDATTPTFLQHGVLECVNVRSFRFRKQYLTALMLDRLPRIEVERHISVRRRTACKCGLFALYQGQLLLASTGIMYVTSRLLLDRC
jgi:hypothetical protein